MPWGAPEVGRGRLLVRKERMEKEYEGLVEALKSAMATSGR